MNKVRITREQEEAVNKFKNHEFILEDFVNSRGKFFDELKSLNTLSVDEMAIALYTGDYEIKLALEVNEWVVDIYEGTTTIETIEKLGIWIKNDRGTLRWVHFESESYQRLRHATQEEIGRGKENRKWRRIGRDYWELAVGDIIDINDEHFSIYEVTKVEYMLDKNDGYGPAPILIRELENLIENGNVEVVCFADNKEDIHD